RMGLRRRRSTQTPAISPKIRTESPPKGRQISHLRGRRVQYQRSSEGQPFARNSRAELGDGLTAPQLQEIPIAPKRDKMPPSMKQTLIAELLAEFLGTLVLILFGNGVVAMVMLFGHGLPGEIVNGGYTNITFAWG